MISEEQRAEIRCLFFAEHWKVGTIVEQLGVHRDTVLRAIEVDRFVSKGRHVPSALGVLEDLAQEPETHRRYSEYYAYEFFVVRRQ